MKLKLFLISIFVLLSIVGYKTYKEIKAIKSIDSYETCAAAKGSLIQESYPATCVTRLGARFTQSLPIPKLTTYVNNEMGVSFEYPSNLTAYGNADAPGVSLGLEGTGGLSFEVNLFKNTTVNKLFNQTSSQYTQSANQQSRPVLKNININSFNGQEAIFPAAVMGADLREIYFQRGSDTVVIILPAYEESPSNKILSTFHFLD